MVEPAIIFVFLGQKKQHMWRKYW